MPILSCDIDSTVNDHWRRIQRNSVNGVIQPSAWTAAEVMQDQPLEGAIETLLRFKAAGWQIRYLSARHWDMPSKAVTVAWLWQHGFPNPEDVHLVPNMDAKIDYLRKYPADLHIDDFTWGQEFGQFRLRDDLINLMPCPFEVFEVARGDWASLAAKYFRVLPNGEPFWKFQVRNLEWWRVNREHEARSRLPYYQNFLSAVRFSVARHREKVVAEIGAGPFGGMLKEFSIGERRYYVDPLASAQRTLGFVPWDSAEDIHVDAEAEELDAIAHLQMPALPERVDLVLSYNALDHGHDIRKALREVVRVAREAYIAFDCKGTGTPAHDRLDHYQTVEYGAVTQLLEEQRATGAIRDLRMGDLRQLTPGFQFEHNWGFPVFYAHFTTREYQGHES